MNRIFSHILTLCLLMTASASFATEITHHIGDKIRDYTLELSSGNTVGETDDGLVYTCYGDAVFTYDDYGNMYIKLKKVDEDYVVISPPLSKLSELWIYPLSPRTINVADIKVAISTDGETWTDTSVQMDYSKTTYVKATIPVRAYYIKITTAKKMDWFITKIKYTYLDCNCFSVTP